MSLTYIRDTHTEKIYTFNYFTGVLSKFQFFIHFPLTLGSRYYWFAVNIAEPTTMEDNNGWRMRGGTQPVLLASGADLRLQSVTAGRAHTTYLPFCLPPPTFLVLPRTFFLSFFLFSESIINVFYSPFSVFRVSAISSNQPSNWWNIFDFLG